jgi:uncharacterized protein
MARKIESHFIDGPAGRLESLLEEPEAGEPLEAALVCHPHPLYGGTMHNKVVYRLARAFRRSGAAVLRFNFRGVNLSEGAHDEGIGEQDDAGAALAFLRARYPNLPYSLAGFSFGSRVALRVGCSLGDVRRVVAAGYPTTFRDSEFLATCRVPRIFVQSTHDQFGPRAELEALFEKLPEPKRLRFVEAKDHFFAGALDEFEQAIYELIQDPSSPVNPVRAL